ncbi:MAG: outer membrane lipoprotein chaperone LolA [Azoarcus sp.]|jgi:outer membrane lipoprotein carrier protein|nr:outer membrane lipoprotein chaperone LolA [Azoarcus sp.]
MEYMRFVFTVFMALAAGSAAAADAVEKLRHFVASARSAEGEFQQTVIGESGRPPQQTTGKFAFSRPGKFRWEYELPYPQLLVGDGKRLWSWDRDLNQVTVRPLGNALGATPAAILFGQGGELERDFDLAEGAANGEDEIKLKLVWIEARPRAAANPENGGGTGFQLIRFGFDGERLQRMVLHDNFGQTTVVAFSRLRLNPRLDPGIFHFEAPAGADILGDPSSP